MSITQEHYEMLKRMSALEHDALELKAEYVTKAPATSTLTLSELLRITKAPNGEFYKIEDFFPDCVLPNCHFNEDCTKKLSEVRTETHQHILPKQRQVFDSIHKFTFGQGGVGSAKSVAFASRCVALSLVIPGNEGVVCRRDYKLLYKSSWKDVKACNKRLMDRGIIEQQKLYSSKTQGDYSVCTYHNGSILYAIQGKNWTEALGASYGLYWVDDCMESFVELFVGDDTSAGLISRLRLPHVHYHKLTYDVSTREHGLMSGMVSTNPPPVGHWSHKLFGDKPGLHKLGDDYVEWIMSSSLENPFTGGRTYANMLIASQKQMGNSDNIIRRVVHGESIPAYGGVPVFGKYFSHEKHLAPLRYRNDTPIIRSWDFGVRHPGVVFSHLYTCKAGNHHYFSIAELGELYDIHVWDLYKEVKRFTERSYKDCPLILDAGDRSGYRKSDTEQDKRGPIRILQSEFNLRFKWKYLDLEKSLDYMRYLLSTTCKCGLEFIMVSEKCPILQGALEGGYKYTKNREGITSPKPYEDLFFADIACAWRYGAENYVKYGVPHEYRMTLRQQNDLQRNHHLPLKKDPWSWMEASDERMAQLVST